VSWRTLALAACWIAAAGWGIYYLIVRAGSSPAYVANAVEHFVVALLAMFASGLHVRLAIAFGGPELFFAPLGMIAAAAFVLGYVVLIWLVP
jgi:hypothetical protein